MRPHYSELCQSTGSLLTRFVFTVISKHLDRLYISWSCQHWSVLYFLYVGSLSSLESSKDDFEEPLDDSSGRQSRRVECKRTSRRQKSRTSTRLRSESSQTKECKNSQTVNCHFPHFYSVTELRLWLDLFFYPFSVFSSQKVQCLWSMNIWKHWIFN